MVYITSRRYTVRSNQNVEVKVYTNQPVATLTANGKSFGDQTVTDHIARWQLTLQQGRNQIEVTAGPVRDSVEWEYKPGSVPPGPSQEAVSVSQASEQN